jgi:hypothetical protein
MKSNAASAAKLLNAPSVAPTAPLAAVRKSSELSLLRSLYESKPTRRNSQSSFLSRLGKLRQSNRRITTTGLPDTSREASQPVVKAAYPTDLVDRALDELARLKSNGEMMLRKELHLGLEGSSTGYGGESAGTPVQTGRDLYSEYSSSLMNVPPPKSDRIHRKLNSSKPAVALMENFRDISPMPARRTKLPQLKPRFVLRHWN